jgi:hypothetical protein
MYPNDLGRLAVVDVSDNTNMAEFSGWKSGYTKASIATNVIAKYRVVSAVMRFHFT